MLSKYLKPFHVNNADLIRFGPKYDGGYVIDKRIISTIEEIVTCGLNDDWEFEKSFLKIKPSCLITAYDHTVNKKFWIKRIKKDLIDFFLLKKLSFKKIINIFKYIEYILFFKIKATHHKLKISTHNIKDKEIMLTDVLKGRKNLILKIDIEGDEYKILSSILKNSDKINCLLIEFHYIDINIDLIEKFIISSNDLKLVHIHGNNYAGNNNNGDPNLIELTFINTKIIDVELKKTNKSYPVNTLDYKNHQKKGDFILEFEDDIKIS